MRTEIEMFVKRLCRLLNECQKTAINKCNQSCSMFFPALSFKEILTFALNPNYCCGATSYIALLL